MNSLTEYTIIQEATRHFNALTGANTKFSPAASEETDGTLQVLLGKEKHTFFVEVKNELRETNLQPVIKHIGKDKEQWLIACRYIPQPVKNQLKSLGLNYMESAGNCFIRAGSLFLFINDQAVTPARQTATGKLWGQSGLKFLFVIISEPALLNGPYRTIAKKAGIALGNIGTLLDELREAGFAKEHEPGHFLLDHKEKLVDRWAEMYHLRLRPKLARGRFRFLKNQVENWQGIEGDFYWGGEPAGAIYTSFLKPETFTVYTTGKAPDLMKTLAAVPAGDGNIEWMEQFWSDTLKTADAGKGHVVPPLLAYAELAADLDSRNLEVATRIKENYLL